jgi:hypothetical protein
MAKPSFTTHFRDYACEGDSIESRVTMGGFYTGLHLVATIYRDDDTTPPDKRQDGYWPSLDPNDNGYIGAKSKATLARHTKRAKDALEGWNNDDWFYCGVAVRAWFDDIPLTEEFAHAVWGVECNYPSGRKNRNAYLLELANESAVECSQEAIRALSDMLESSE